MSAKQSFDDYDDLFLSIEDDIQASLEQNVAPVIEKKLQESAEKTAAGWSSRAYMGIADEANIMSDVYPEADGSFTLITKDTATPQPSVFGYGEEFDESQNVDGTKFSEWIDEGEWMDLKSYLQTGEKAKRSPRPFVSNVQKKLDDNPSIIEDALFKGL